MPVNRRLVEIDKGRAERRKILLRKCGLVGGGDSAAMDVDDQGEPEDVIRAKEREEIEGILGSMSSTGESTIDGYEDAADTPICATSQSGGHTRNCQKRLRPDSESPLKDMKNNKKKEKEDQEEEELTGYRAELQQDENFDPAPFSSLSSTQICSLLIYRKFWFHSNTSSTV
ncbi:hypothetical protein BDZ89DRAFT_1128251 [Hymenopellis radicata]|nr:hypothetical protein BDZ89DRAFT_1128251 [Hymenopellis radicata]